MSYEPDADMNSSLFASTSGKKMVFLTVIITVGGFFGIQAMFGFPIKDLIRSDITEQSKIIIKSAGTCVVVGSDQHPRGISNCPYKVGDTLVITYKQGTASIEKYRLRD
jgi:hypothetical protein